MPLHTAYMQNKKRISGDSGIKLMNISRKSKGQALKTECKNEYQQFAIKFGYMSKLL